MPNTKLTKERLILHLIRLSYDTDKEVAHDVADSFLLEYIGDEEITRAFREGRYWCA